ncbi:uncharacterized protein LOC113235746 isoform X2 [Hyposmocoma kahamanoa]|uniref:uncharacterized protein LOC113235746 isoform X2 n=1 Tax=Hyposmocoma kahamanoa TaxID=1477025 RepID=UPI000E6D6390|nr:uncharacterized protein LOC113235746 isoform X2 [Hyposmocoma kahamanoa]
MGLTSNTGLLASVSKTNTQGKRKIVQEQNVELRCEVTPAPFMLRPYAGLYNPFSNNCSVLCNHPADTEVRVHMKRVKDAWNDGKNLCGFFEDLSKLPNGQEKIRTPHDIVTEDMFRRYTETDSRPLTPAPTLASGKSRGSRRCLTPDQPHVRTTIVVDLRRSHSQETLYYHGYTTSDMTVGNTTIATNERSTLPSLHLSEGTHNRLIKGQCQQLPPLASPLVLSKRNIPVKEPLSVRAGKKNQLKALNLGKPAKSKTKQTEAQLSQRSNTEKESNDGSEAAVASIDDGGSGEGRRRGKRRRKGRPCGSDRLASAGLAAQTQQDPETQIAGIGTDSHNPSSRASIVPSQVDDDVIVLPVIKPRAYRKTDSFLDDDLLKFLHREVDEEAIETEFDVKRRYVFEEALRTRPDRAYNQEMQNLLRELNVPAVSLGDWLHIPRVFSRQNAQFSLPIDTDALEHLTPMQYAARYVTIKKSKQLLYLTVLRKFMPQGYAMPVKDIEDGLILMMGGILTKKQANDFKALMKWDTYEDENNNPEDIKLTLVDSGLKRNVMNAAGDTGEIELSDFTMIETKLAILKVDSGLVEILNTIRVR